VCEDAKVIGLFYVYLCSKIYPEGC